MKRIFFPLCLATAVALLVPRLLAQIPQDALHAPDGNSFTRIVSILIPPLANAPFTATVSLEWTRQTSDGATIILKNQRLVARDSRGRVFEERRRFVPADSAAPSLLFETDYVDPASHAKWVCYPSGKVCDVYGYSAVVNEATVPVGPLGDGHRYLRREDMGKGQFEGLETIGTRETTTTNPGTVGNDREVVFTKEFWYSPKLGVNLVVKRMDPTQGTQVFTVSNISLAEPDARLFAVPPDYKLTEQRATSPAAAK